MRAPLAICLILLPGIASAHVGHWAPAAGHDHILLGLGIGIAILGGLTALGKRKGREAEAIEVEEDTEDRDTQA
ncbi:MAG: DUF6732 family protein [Pseudomonadota bacterium]